MELMQSILRRRSGRSYTEATLPETVIRQIVEAGLLAPSSRNLKSTSLIVVRQRETLLQLAEAKTAGGGMLKTAACGIVVVGNSALSDAWIEDGSIAMTQMMLRAADLGVANCWVQIRNRFAAGETADTAIPAGDIIRQMLGIPDTHSVLAVLALGWPAAEAAPHTLDEIDSTRVHFEQFSHTKSVNG